MSVTMCFLPIQCCQLGGLLKVRYAILTWLACTKVGTEEYCSVIFKYSPESLLNYGTVELRGHQQLYL